MIPPKRVLLVEGHDDLHIAASLFQHHKTPEVFEINQTGGIDRLLEVVPVQLKATGMERLGIVVDADLDVTARWNSIRSILLAAGFLNIPNTPDNRGTIVRQQGLPDFGVWLMPNNKTPGLIEDFATCLIPENDSLSKRAANALEGIPAAERLFSEAHKSKAHIHTWLAWQADPGTPMGFAITKKYLQAGAPTALGFLDWVVRLLVNPR